jgi:hypothetical protein
VDDDCDGDVNDEGAANCLYFYRDDDGDTFGLSGDRICVCEATSPYTTLSDGDCNDANQYELPGGTEICGDGHDNDCSGDADGGDAVDASTWYRDLDTDGYGDTADSTSACTEPSGFVADGTDCDDSLADVNPGQVEQCLTTDDDDCSGSTNDTGATNCVDYFRDDDGDGYGLSTDSLCLCEPDGAYSRLFAGDCDDTDPLSNPGGTESCDSTADEDCDGIADEADAENCTNYYLDDDGDGYGTGSANCLCSADGNYRATALGDCDDQNASTNPGALNCGLRGELFPSDAFVYFDSSRASAAGDFNGDGIMDYLEGHGEYDGTYQNMGAVYLFLGPITATPTTPDWMITGVGAQDGLGNWTMLLADHDCDGDLELLTFAGSTGIISIEPAAISQTGVTTDHALVTQIYGGTGSSRFVGDVDGDGCDDYLMVSTLQYGDPAGPISSSWYFDSYYLASLDLNGDGLTDLVSASSNDLYITHGTGTREMSAPPRPATFQSVLVSI